jgi:signal transduction histidine kinase
MGSRNTLNSVFQNLLTNAIKFRHPDRLPKISIGGKVVGDKLELRLADNGMGIDLEKHGGKVFKMFTRLSTGVEGTGVGLFIVKRSITKLGGSIDVESEPGRGTTFLIQLPHTQPK